MYRSVLLFAALLLASTAFTMELGTNFWNLKWTKSDTCFDNVKNVNGENPWNPQFLKEIAIYRCFRFMDWDYTNGSTRAKWDERTQKSAPDQSVAAYEWMIDLCNQMGADMWVCIPHLTVTHDTGDKPCDYALRLSLLVKTGVDMREVDLTPMLDKLQAMTAEQLIAVGGVKTSKPLKPALKLYLEYSNETWNGAFKQSHYCVDEGTALQLDPTGAVGKDGKQWTSGFRYHAWAAIRVFHAGDLVFGADSPRVVRVFAQQLGSIFQAKQHQAMIDDPQRNPWKVKADAIAIAPYFGNKVLGDDPQAAVLLKQAISDVAVKVAGIKKYADSTNVKLIAYEGGQTVTKMASVINRKPAMYDLYTEYLNEMSKYFTLFNHYAHVGRAGNGGAWGSIEFTGQPLADAPKYRALCDWIKAHPSSSSDTPAK